MTNHTLFRASADLLTQILLNEFIPLARLGERDKSRMPQAEHEEPSEGPGRFTVQSKRGTRDTSLLQSKSVVNLLQNVHPSVQGRSMRWRYLPLAQDLFSYRKENYLCKACCSFIYVERRVTNFLSSFGNPSLLNKDSRRVYGSAPTTPCKPCPSSCACRLGCWK